MILRSLLLSLLVLLVAPTRARAWSEDEPVMQFQLRGGAIQWGTLRSHDPEGLTFVRLDNGGTVRLPWGALDPRQERELRVELGYIDLTGDEVMMSADRLELTDGTELIGVIVDRTPDAILIKTSTATVPVPKNRIGGPSTTVQVPALTVYTKEELYSRELATTPTSPNGQYALAQYCERILDFAHAAEHYKKAAELDPGFRPDDVRAAVARATEKAKNQDQLDYLSQIDLSLARRRYDEAAARADAFASKYPDSPLIADAKKKKDRVIKARDRYIGDQVANLWLTRASRLANKAAIEKTYSQVLAYLDGEMKKELAEVVTKDALKISKEVTTESVRQLWAKRSRIHWYRASYGYGTWLLGEDAALKGQETEKPKEVLTEKDKERAELEQRIQRFLKNQEMARKGKEASEKKDDAEAAWKELSSAARAGWILAYYAENSGDFEVGPKPLFAACRECGGKGVLEIAYVGMNPSKTATGKGSQNETVECPTCHGLGVIRRILYR